MKKTLTAFLAALVIGVSSAYAFDPKDLLKGLGNATSQSQSESSSNDQTGGTSSDAGSTANGGGILGAIGGFINNAMANNKFSVDDLVGTWNYTSPAVTFQSENALMNIGGAGAATALENKLEPYYTKLGFNKTTLTVDKEHNFELKMGLLQLKGTVEKGDDNSLVFNFAAFGKIPLGKVSANATKAMNTLNLTFEATRLVQMLTKLTSVLNMSSVNALASLLNSYDGIYLGFKLKKA